MILVDTSVWVDHIRHRVTELVELLESDRCVLHPYVLAELALGSLPDWQRRIAQLRCLPSIDPVSQDRLLSTIDELKLQGSGLGFVDAHLLTACLASDDTKLWSRDRKLVKFAEQAGVSWTPA